jgi:hypothetical protein
MSKSFSDHLTTSTGAHATPGCNISIKGERRLLDRAHRVPIHSTASPTPVHAYRREYPLRPFGYLEQQEDRFRARQIKYLRRIQEGHDHVMAQAVAAYAEMGTAEALRVQADLKPIAEMNDTVSPVCYRLNGSAHANPNGPWLIAQQLAPVQLEEWNLRIYKE